MKVFSGLDNPAVQNGFGHTPCVGILSGYFNKLQRKNRLSIDQAIADLIGDDTRFKSLVFQAGENLNFSQISWDKHGLPVYQIDSPRKIFNLLFQINEKEKLNNRFWPRTGAYSTQCFLKPSPWKKISTLRIGLN